MALTPPPTPPSRADSPSTFSTRADALLGWLPTMTTELGALQVDVAAKQSTATSAANTATTQAASASTSATAASSSATQAAALANNKGLWANLTGALSMPASVIYNNQVWTLNTNTSDVTADTPGVSAKWTLFFQNEVVYTITDGASVDLNPANGTIQLWTLGANRSPTATNFLSGQSMTLMVNDGTAYAVTWPSVTWVNGAIPTLATSGYTIVVLFKVSTTLYGAYVGEVA